MDRERGGARPEVRSPATRAPRPRLHRQSGKTNVVVALPSRPTANRRLDTNRRAPSRHERAPLRRPFPYRLRPHRRRAKRVEASAREVPAKRSLDLSRAASFVSIPHKLSSSRRAPRHRLDVNSHLPDPFKHTPLRRHAPRGLDRRRRLVLPEHLHVLVPSHAAPADRLAPNGVTPQGEVRATGDGAPRVRLRDHGGELKVRVRVSYDLTADVALDARRRGDGGFKPSPGDQTSPRRLRTDDGAHLVKRESPGVQRALVFGHHGRRALPPAKATGTPVNEPPRALDPPSRAFLPSVAQKPGA